jgi:CBS domain containing-hemolysin-like protein
MSSGLILLFVYVGGALTISFLCSLLEAGLLSARETELSARAAAGERGAAILLDLKQNRIDDAISAILTLNTIAHTIGATLAGAQAALVFGDAWVGVFSGVLTLLVLIVTEIIPKTLGAVKASQLAGFVGRTTALLIKLLFPVIAATGALTRLLAREEKPPISRAEIAALLAAAAGQGTLRKDQKRFFDNVLQLDRICVSDVMTPRTVATMLPETAPISELLDSPAPRAFSRIPLHGKTRDEVAGYVVQREVLDAVARGTERSKPLGELARPVFFLTDKVAIANALQQFLKRREHLAMVTDEFGAISGLVTLEDLIETVLGVEIVDESDQTVDMRQLAMKLRDERMAQLRAQRAIGLEEKPEPSLESKPESEPPSSEG